MHLAQFNLARLAHGPDDPRLARFGIGANMIRRAAASAPGHVWNEQDVFDDVFFATRSVWTSAEALRDFVYSGIHRRYLDRSATWFKPTEGPTMVLWWVTEGERPSLEEARSRLERLRRRGAGPDAFDFAWRHLSAPDARGS
jgi:hypothetical protein